MGGHDVLEYILGFKATLVLWGDTCTKYISYNFRALLFIILLVFLDTKFATLIPLP
jgi:hypothetical protein